MKKSNLIRLATLCMVITISQSALAEIPFSVLQAAASKVSAASPYMLDKLTRMDGAVASPTKVTYKVTLLFKPAKTELSQQDVRSRNFVCTDPDMQGFVKNGISIVYAYYADNGTFIHQTTISPSDCKSLNKVPNPAVHTNAAR